MYYRIERTYLANELTGSSLKADVPHYVSSESALLAASRFVNQDGARLIGPVSDLPGDKATATAWRDGSLYIVFVERGDEGPFRPSRVRF